MRLVSQELYGFAAFYISKHGARLFVRARTRKKSTTQIESDIMPKFAEFAERVLELVADELEVAKEQILSKSRKAETVDARHMAVKLLHANNVYPSKIAGVFGLTTRNIQYVITSFDSRIQTNRSLRNSYAKIAKQLGENSEATAK